MKTLLTFLIVVFAIAGLSGCSETMPTKYEVVEKQIMSVAQFDESLLSQCTITEPPAAASYKAANRDAKEAILIKYISYLMIDAKRCNLDKATLQAMLNKQKAFIQKFNEDEENRMKKLLESQKGKTE